MVCRGEGMDQISKREPSIWERKKIQILNEEIFLNFSIVTLVHNMHSLLTIIMSDYKQTLWTIKKQRKTEKYGVSISKLYNLTQVFENICAFQQNAIEDKDQHILPFN